MISDDDVGRLKRAKAEASPGHDGHYLNLMHRHFPGLLARLEFAERCLADLHDETHAAEAIVRMRKALEAIRREADYARGVEPHLRGVTSMRSVNYIDGLALEALEDTP